jgi:hypothetical protein
MRGTTLLVTPRVTNRVVETPTLRVIVRGALKSALLGTKPCWKHKHSGGYH